MIMINNRDLTLHPLKQLAFSIFIKSTLIILPLALSPSLLTLLLLYSSPSLVSDKAYYTFRTPYPVSAV